ncbi:MAG: site-2 protease family protein [Pyrobaculum sp.]
METWLIFIISWLAVVATVYAINRKAVRYFVAIYWKNENMAKYIEFFTKRLSFIPLRLYLALVIFLALLPVFLFMPFVRPSGEIQLISGFIYMLLGGTINAAQKLLGGATVQEAAARSAGVTPIIPGITLPWDQLPYIAIAIVVAVALHEFMHGYAALRYGIPIKSVGVFSLFYILSGAFVEPDEEKFKEARTEAKLAVLASGVAINVVLAVTAMAIGVLGAWLGLYGVAFGKSAVGIEAGDRVVEIEGCGYRDKVYSPDDFITKINVLAGLGPLLGINQTALCRPGDKVTLVASSWLERYQVSVDFSHFATPPRIVWLYQDGSLYQAGVREGDVVRKIEGCGLSREITWSGELMATLLELRQICRPGEVVRVTVERNKAIELNMTLIERDGRIYFGVGFGSLPFWGLDWGPITRDDMYNTDFAKLVFWLVVVNYGLAVLNALPIYPLDGGQMLAVVAQRRFGEKSGKKVVAAVTWMLAVLLMFNITLGLLGEQYKILQSIR